jgi:hypothetical protein
MLSLAMVSCEPQRKAELEAKPPVGQPSGDATAQAPSVTVPDPGPLFAAGKWTEALLASEQRLVQAPADSSLHYYRIGSLLSLGRVEQARAATTAQIRDTPLGATYTLAVLARNFGDLDWAEQILRQCESVLRPGDLFCRRVLIEILVSEGRIETAGALVSSWLSVSQGVGDGELLHALASGTITKLDLDRREAAVGARHSAALRARMAELGFPTVRPLPFVVTPDARADLPIEWGNASCIVRARINKKHDVRLMVDTGADHLSLSRATAQRLGLSLEAQVQVHGAGGEGSTQRGSGRVDELALGEVVWRDVPAILSYDITRGAGEVVDGVLGTALLRDFLVDLDLVNSRLRLVPPADRDALPAAQAASTSLVFVLDGGLIYIPVGINDLVLGFFLLDTGASVTMLNRRHLATLLADAEVKRKAVGPNPRELRSVGVGGTDTPTEIEPLQLGVGILRLTADPILEAPHPFERNVWLSGVVGMQVLHRCRITLDYHNQIVTFWTPSDYVPPEYRVPQPAVRLMNNLAARLGNPLLPNQRLVR